MFFFVSECSGLNWLDKMELDKLITKCPVMKTNQHNNILITKFPVIEKRAGKIHIPENIRST